MPSSVTPHIELPDNLAVDWAWVENALVQKEHIASASVQELHRNIAHTAAAILTEAQTLVTPRAMLSVKKITAIDGGTIGLDGNLIIATPTIAATLRQATYLAIFVMTIGRALEERSATLMAAGDLLGGYLLDTVGSFAVESLAERIEEVVHAQCHGCGMSASMRFSPGYCDWPLDDQRVLARAVDFSSIGVTLNAACMMLPRKSISAVIALGAREVFTTRMSPCAHCTQQSCDYRRVKK